MKFKNKIWNPSVTIEKNLEFEQSTSAIFALFFSNKLNFF